MFLKRRVEELEHEFDAEAADSKTSFNNVKIDVDNLNNRINRWAERHSVMRKDLDELLEELATNGVIRDIRQLQREMESVMDKFSSLERNGVVTAINKLNQEVFKDRKHSDNPFHNIMVRMSGQEPGEEVTLAGKVDAIIEHLNLNVEVQPSKTTPAKVVTKKVKKGKK